MAEPKRLDPASAGRTDKQRSVKRSPRASTSSGSCHGVGGPNKGVRRDERRAGGIETEVVEDAARDGGLGDEGDELHPAGALGTGEDVEREDLL